MQRSRCIKLQLRDAIVGDFVYLDTDVLVVQPEGWQWPRSCAAMALDAHKGVPGELPPKLKQQYSHIGWPYPIAPYFNAGVILWRDTSHARQFAAAWRTQWQHSVMAGVPYDQPALAHANRACGGPVEELPSSFNVPVFRAPGAARGAHVWHFWPYTDSDRMREGSLLHSLVEHYQESGTLDWAVFDRALKDRYPWAATRGPRFMLRHGYYRRALLGTVTRLVSLLPQGGAKATTGDAAGKPATGDHA